MTTSARTTKKGREVVVFTQIEAARRVGVSRWTLHRAIKAGLLPAHRVGGVTLIYSDDLLEYVLAHRDGVGIPA